MFNIVHTSCVDEANVATQGIVNHLLIVLICSIPVYSEWNNDAFYDLLYFFSCFSFI